VRMQQRLRGRSVRECMRDGMHADVDVDTVPRACMQAKAFTHVHTYSVRLYAPMCSSHAHLHLHAPLHTHTHTHIHTHTYTHTHTH
jgi:hypothetical protein